VGGYSDWEARGGSLTDALAVPVEKLAKKASYAEESNVDQTAAKKRKLSYKEQRELGSLPRQIESLEQNVARLTAAMSEPGFYQSGFADIQRLTQELAEAQLQLDTAFQRWGQLENP
jgi:ABC transport system ATP-binding/permease protein